MMAATRAALLLCLLLALALLPFITNSQYIIGVAISGLLFTVAAAALNLVFGYAGLLSFAQLGFWGVGGYAAALSVQMLGVSFWLALLLAGLLNAALAAMLGLLALRTGRHAFVIVTLAFALLCSLVARDWENVTHGALGIPGLPAPMLWGHAVSRGAGFYYLSLVYALGALGTLLALGTSRIGLVLRALRQNEILACAQGISPLPYKLAAFVLGAILTGIAGGIFVFHLTIVDPTIFDFYYMQTFLIIVIIGGAGSFWGVVIMGLAMVALPELLRASHDLRMVIYGAILLVAMLALPDGVAGLLARRRAAS